MKIVSLDWQWINIIRFDTRMIDDNMIFFYFAGFSQIETFFHNFWNVEQGIESWNEGLDFGKSLKMILMYTVVLFLHADKEKDRLWHAMIF